MQNPAGDTGERATRLWHWSKIKLSGHQFSYSICTPFSSLPWGVWLWGSSPNFFFSYQTETSHWEVTKSKATCTIAPNSVFSKAIKHPQPKSPHDVGLCPSETGPILEIWAYLAQLESRYIKQPKVETDPLNRGARGLILLLIPSFSLFASIYTVYPKRLEII